MTDRELMQQALDALWGAVSTCFDQYSHEQVMSNPKHFINQTIETLRARLAQPDPEPDLSVVKRIATQLGWTPPTGKTPEPVAWMTDRDEIYFDKEDARRYSDGFIQPLYAAPPQREWVGLTEIETIELAGGGLTRDERLFARAIEARLKEKNT